MRYSVLLSSVIAAIFVAAFATPAKADECDKLTYFTFSAPVALPGVTLPAGTYRFTHPDCGETDHILRISSQDGSEVFGTFIAIPEERTASSSVPSVTFEERRAGTPEAVKAFFYPGDRTGDELIYPTHERHLAGPA